jgi:antitoxin PrlF
MQATLSISGRGLIAIPAEMRREVGLSPHDNLIAETTKEGILLRPAITLPVELYTAERIADFDAEEAALSKVLKSKPAR